MKRCLTLSDSLGIYAVEVSAIDEGAKNFYLKYGFTPLVDNDLHLYLPLKTVEEMAARADRGPNPPA